MPWCRSPLRALAMHLDGISESQITAGKKVLVAAHGNSLR